MQLGSSTLTPEEWRRRQRYNLCLYCDRRGTSSLLAHQKGGLTSKPRVMELVSLVDSGADVNIISREAANQLGLGCEPLSRTVPVQALDGNRLGTVSHQTGPVDMLLADMHLERTWFHILISPACPWFWGSPGSAATNPTLAGKLGSSKSGSLPVASPA